MDYWSKFQAHMHTPPVNVLFVINVLFVVSNSQDIPTTPNVVQVLKMPHFNQRLDQLR